MKSYMKYEEFIAKRRLVKPHHAKYYVNHVRTYLDVCGYDRRTLTHHSVRLLMRQPLDWLL